ncbi:hypothetical protein PJI17_08905 [Mycobacterium kansasii]
MSHGHYPNGCNARTGTESGQPRWRSPQITTAVDATTATGIAGTIRPVRENRDGTRGDTVAGRRWKSAVTVHPSRVTLNRAVRSASTLLSSSIRSGPTPATLELTQSKEVGVMGITEIREHRFGRPDHRSGPGTPARPRPRCSP